jgi:rsbT co-antagonist protein RsbR
MHGAILAVVVALISFIGASGTSSALREARAARQQAEEASAGLREAHASLEEQVRKRTAALQVALSEVEEHAAEQTRLLSENERQRLEIRELSVPVLPVAEQVLVMPLVGTLDEQRLMMLQEQALRAVEQMSARQLIVDITGVPLVDSHVAAGLFNVVQAARLLGAEVTLVGIRPEVAQAIVGLGIHMNTIRTYVDLRSALTHHSTPRSVWRHNAAN